MRDDDRVSDERLRQIATGRGEGGALLSADERSMARELLAARAALEAADDLTEAASCTMHLHGSGELDDEIAAYLRARGAR